MTQQWLADEQLMLLDRDIPKRICYLVDYHRDFYRKISTAQMITSIPIVGVPCLTLISIPLIIAFDTAGLDQISKLIFEYRPIKPPISHAECPQCRRFIEKTTVKITSNSPLLELYYQFKRVVRGGTILTIFSFSLLNLGKWWFKVGLWQLRKIFPEEVLRAILDISTTKALDVYSESINGLISIPDISKFIVFGFPIYLISLAQPSQYFSRWKWLWPLATSLRASNYDKVPRGTLYYTLSITNAGIWAYNILGAPIINELYSKMIAKVKPYYIDDIAEILGEDETDGELKVNSSTVLIRTNWYDVIFESAMWPLLGGYMGDKILDGFILFQNRFRIKLGGNISPNELKMIFRVMGCGTVALMNQLFKLYLSYLRMRELEELQRSMSEAL